jgi:hypothetical protein
MRLCSVVRRSGVGVIGAGLLATAAFAAPAGAAPTVARVVGEVDRITVKDAADKWSEARMVVGGQDVIIPRNLLVDLPANRSTVQGLFTSAPAGCLARGETGLAKSDACNTSGMGGIATIEGNRTAAGDVIAGDVFLEKGVESISGTVTAIDYAEGSFRVNGTAGDATTGVLVRLNDPGRRHTRQQGGGCRGGSENCSPDPRFTEDPDNYTQSFSTGYPLCIPSTVARTFTDELDVNGNGDRTETLTAQAAPDGTGDLLCPDANRRTLVAQDSRRLAPIQVGDSLTVQGNFETVGGVRFLSAWSTMIGTALSTTSAPGQPDYMMLNEMFMDAAGFDRNRARDLFIGATTEATSDVAIWTLHRDPVTNEGHEFPLATVRGCDAAAGAGQCTNVLGPNTFRVRHDVDFAGGTKPTLDPCAQLRADPRFSAKGICPNGGTTTEQFAILSPTPREVQARTGRKMADLARPGGPLLRTIDIEGADAPNGQYLFPMGIALGGIEAPFFPEININALDTPTIFAGLPWNLDRRLSPNGCDGACEDTPQPLDPFPFSQRDPRTQSPTLPAGPYSDPNYTASRLSTVRNRILSFVSAAVGSFDGDRTVLAWPPADPPKQPTTPAPPAPGTPGDTTAPTAPTGLSAAGVTPRRIDLRWTASTDDVGVTHYLVYRDDAPNPIATIAATSTVFADAGVAAGSTHSYAVQAVDAAGNTSDKSAPATATATAPRVSLTPASLAFADQLTGTPSAVQTITVNNLGDADLAITTATIAGADAGDFAKGVDGCAGATVAPARSCTVEVLFDPATPGVKTAALEIRDNATGSPHTATLSGKATAAPPPPAPAPGPAAVALPLARPGAGSVVTQPPPDGALAPALIPLGALPLAALPAIPNVASPLSSIFSTRPVVVSSLRVQSTVSAASTAPITVTATVPSGATLVQIRVFRIARASGSRSRLVATVVRTTPKAKRYAFRLTERRLRHLTPGRYIVEVRAGSTRADLGPATRRTVAVRKGRAAVRR